MSAKTKWFVGMLLGGLLLDQLTKEWARQALRGQPPRTVIAGFWDFRYAENPGMAFTSSGGRPFLIGAGIVILTVLFIAAWRGDRADRRLGAALGLLAAGGAGNLIDRIFVGKVVDFVHWHAGSFVWPTFNVADAALVFGIAALFLVRKPRPVAAGQRDRL